MSFSSLFLKPFFQIYLHIIGRIVLMISMTYSFGKGQFWPLMLLIGIHMMAIAIGCLISRVRHIGQELNAQLVVYSCLFGLANIYCPNWISYENSNENKKGTHSYTILRELVIQMAFILENLAMLSVVVYSVVANETSVIYGQTILMYLAITATVVHLVGVCLRVLYYKNYHIWRNILWKDFKSSCKRVFGFEPKIQQSNIEHHKENQDEEIQMDELNQ